MATRECPICESRAGLNMMAGEITQLIDVATDTPQLTDWTCGFCGYQESEVTQVCSLGGMKSVITPVEPPEVIPEGGE